MEFNSKAREIVSESNSYLLQWLRLIDRCESIQPKTDL